ncbi:hypothetical protein DHEL01_v211892 [Diaporthe helianthi]|uniref:Uncharacterized protein n=1 Tax=Diaporthe helianthi TaxID=158607 RepID=A0A2P5HHJ0_DIAHE|nr:hypothetical protein DHEL01_v211892 [Diaporthe helianthi]
MPPKKTAGAAAEGGDWVATALCHMIMNCDEFKIDTNKLTPTLSPSMFPDVCCHFLDRKILTTLRRPRKINSMINAYGFEFKNGKVIQSGSQAPAAPAGPSTNASASENGKDEKTKARQGPASKKRKIADDEDSSDRVKEEDDHEA